MKFTREPEDEEDQLPLYEEMMEHEGHGCAYEVSGRRGYDPDTNSDSEEEMKSGATTNNINVVVCNHWRPPGTLFYQDTLCDYHYFNVK